MWRGEQWVARPGRSCDTQVKRASQSAFDCAVSNTYKVLLTRGVLGSVVYSTDAETQQLLRRLLEGESTSAVRQAASTRAR